MFTPSNSTSIGCSHYNTRLRRDYPDGVILSIRRRDRLHYQFPRCTGLTQEVQGQACCLCLSASFVFPLHLTYAAFLINRTCYSSANLHSNLNPRSLPDRLVCYPIVCLLYFIARSSILLFQNKAWFYSGHRCVALGSFTMNPDEMCCSVTNRQTKTLWIKKLDIWLNKTRT